MSSHLTSLRHRLVALVAVGAVALGLGVVTGSGPVVQVVPQTPTSAADPNSASVLAKRANHSVMVDSASSETAETSANPDGPFPRTSHVKPVRVRRDGGWVEPDPRLGRRADGSWAAKAVLGDTTLSGGRRGAGAPLLQLWNGGVATGFDWLGDLPEPTVSGSVATYAEVLPGVDLKIE